MSLLRSSTLRFAHVLLLAVVLCSPTMAQIPTKCLEIESILVDACNPSSVCGGSTEGQNEMVRFITGPQTTNLSDLEVVWPNNIWLGLVQNATTANNTAQLNATIQSCGFLIEPVGGVIPPGSTVLMVTSTDMCILANSFSALSDTIFIVFQNAGNTAGHFANNPASGQVISPTPLPGNDTRTLIITYMPTACSDTATYVRELVVNDQGTYGGQGGESDGGTAVFSWPGLPQVTYVNFGCQAPFVSLQITGSADGTLCGGVGTVNLAGAINGGDFESILWQGGTGTIGDPTSLNTTYTAGPGDTGNVVLQLCAITDCATPTCTTVIIPAGNGPTVQITPTGSTALCPGDNVVLTASGADSYLWGGGETTTSISVSTPGTYTVTGSNVCGVGDTSIEVTTATGVTVTITGNLVVCPGQTTVLTANGATSYVWLPNGETTQSITVEFPGLYGVTGTSSCGTAQTLVQVAPGVAPAVSIAGDTELCGPETTELTASGADTYVWSTNETTPAITVSAAGTYSVIGTNACGNDTTSVDVSAVAEPTVSITGNLTFCIGQPAILTANGADSYLWSTLETTPTISVETAGTISVVGTSACGTGTDSVEVVSAPGPTVNITGNTTICAGQTTVLTATGADTYLWSTNETTASITVGTAGTFTVTGTDGCGEGIANIEVVFGVGPTVEIQGTTTFCAGGTTQLTATGATSYVWSTTETFETIAVESSGTYTVIGTDACGSDTASVEVTVQPLPIVSVSGVGSICPGGSTVLTATSSDPITWNTSASGPTITVSDAGVYTATATNACGSSSASLTVEVVQLAAAFTASPSSGVAPLTVQFNSTSTSGATHSWVFNDNGTSNLVSPEHLFEEPGTYTVVLTVTADGCTVSTSQVIIVTAVPVPIEESSIEVPNVITPNGDRQNDILTVTTANLATFNMQIFNRWGQKMSELTRANQSWDARTLSGEMVSEGTYFYVLVAEGLDGKKYDLSGHLTVMR